MSLPRPPQRCTCGARYDTFRSGETFASVKRSMYTGPDPSLWVNKSRPAVMREWTRIKRERWWEIHRHCPDTFDVIVFGGAAPRESELTFPPPPDPEPISFKTRAGANAFARARARHERRPIRIAIRAGDETIGEWAGDWHGRVRRAA